MYFPFYVDEEYINILYNQKNRLLIEKTESKTKGKEGLAEVGVENGGIFNKILSLNGKVRVVANGVSINEEKIAISLEEKLNYLIKNETNGVKEIADLLDENSLSKLAYVKGQFILSGMYLDKERNNDIIERIDCISDKEEVIWELQYMMTGINGGLSNFHIQYDMNNGRSELICDYAQGRNKIYDVRMSLDGKKIKMHLKHLTRAIKVGGKFQFEILGLFIKISDLIYSIKPVAIFI